MIPRRGPIAVTLVVLLVAGLALAPAASARKLSLGTAGVDVKHLKARLAALGYLPAKSVDKNFDMATWHAVVAFQGWQRLPVDGIAGGHVRKVMRRALRPAPSVPRTGIEVHIQAQVLLLVRGGYTVRAIHISSGAGDRTPYGHFAIYSRAEMSWSKPFKTWMPYAQYFNGGYALHENASVPAFAASHGCVRIPDGEVTNVWNFGRIGMRVWIVSKHHPHLRPLVTPEQRAARRVVRAFRQFEPLVV